MLTYNSFRPEVSKSYVGRQNLVYLNNFRKSKKDLYFQIFLIIDDISIVSVSQSILLITLILILVSSLYFLFYIIFVFI